MKTRAEQIQKLRFEDGKTLQEIASVYDISKERVRQILIASGGTGGGKFISSYIDSKIEVSENMTTAEAIRNALFIHRRGRGIAEKKMRQIHHAVSGGSAKTGQMGELFISNLLKSKSIENELMPFGSTYDILLSNGYKVDVKSAYSIAKTNPADKVGMYHFSTRKDTKGNYCDFFIFCINNEAVFVVPNSEIKMVNSVYIRYPFSNRSWSNWSSFYERFDLLQK